jgi:hypothetical protein
MVVINVGKDYKEPNVQTASLGSMNTYVFIHPVRTSTNPWLYGLRSPGNLIGSSGAG